MERSMIALQVLRVRISLFTCSHSFRLSTSKQCSAVDVHRRHCSLGISSSPSTSDWNFPASLSSRLLRAYSRGPQALQIGVLKSSDIITYATGGGVTFGLSERGEVFESQTETDTSGIRQFEPDALEVKDVADRKDCAEVVRKDVLTTKEGRPNYLTMSDKELFAKCRMDTYRASGPGGQHRNKTESAVRLTHIPTGLVSQAADDRSQHINRALALSRMREVIAIEVRDLVELEGYTPPPELIRILPSAKGGKRGTVQKIGPNHPEFVLGLKALLDLLASVGGSVADAGTKLGISTGALSKLITSNNLLWQAVNKLRASKGMRPLR